MKNILIIIFGLFAISGFSQTEICQGATANLIPTGAGGSPGYTYTWNTPNPATVGAGTYVVTVTDSNGCSNTASHVVTACPVLAVSGTTVDNTSCSTPNGEVNITPTGGCSGGYTYLWSNAATTQNITGLNGGMYTVTVTTTSATGCVCDVIETFTVVDDATLPTVTITGSCN